MSWRNCKTDPPTTARFNIPVMGWELHLDPFSWWWHKNGEGIRLASYAPKQGWLIQGLSKDFEIALWYDLPLPPMPTDPS